MASCVEITSTGLVRVSTVPVDQCTTYVLATKAEFNQFSTNNLIAALDSLFSFDPVIFSLVSGASLLMFYTSHGAGHVVRWLGRK